MRRFTLVAPARALRLTAVGAALSFVLFGATVLAADGGAGRDAAALPADARPSPEDGDSGMLPCNVGGRATGPGGFGVCLVAIGLGVARRRGRRRISRR